MQIGTKLKLTAALFEDLNLHDLFPDLNTTSLYEVLEIDKISDWIGATKLKDVVTGAIYDIAELNFRQDDLPTGDSYWCFIFDGAPEEYEIFE